MNSQKNNKCFCGGYRVLAKGGKTYCADCFEAGVQSVNDFKEIFKKIDQEVQHDK